jgi:GNAT superfamily N-acetyltransferase
MPLMPLIIRTATPADAEPLARLIAANAWATLAPYYSAVQMEAFLDYYSPPAMKEKIASQFVYCAETDGQLSGTIALTTNGFVVGFYTHADYLGQGIGKALMQHIEQVALQKSFREIRLTASPVGLGFYYKLGWEKLSDYLFQHLGVGFKETLMAKRLR